MFNHFKLHQISLLILIAELSMCFGLSGCSSDEPESNPTDRLEISQTPTKEFKFYKNDNLNWSFKVLPSSDPSAAIITLNSSTAQVNGTGSFYYQMLNKNQASVSCFFTTRIAIGSSIIGQWNQYELTLTFLSSHHGKFEGKMLSNPEDKNGTDIKGMFVYDSELELEDFIDQDFNEIDWEYLTDYKWISNDGFSLTFAKNGTFYSNLSATEEYSGTYKIDKQHNLINLSYSAGFNTQFKVFYLNEEELVMGNSNLPEKDAITYSAYPLTSNSNFTYMQTCWSNIFVRVKIEVPANIKSYGLCYSTHPTPKVTDSYIKEIEHNDNLNHVDIWDLTNLEKKTKYYVRPYHFEGNKAVYYDEFTVTTLGIDKDLLLSIDYDKYQKTATYNSFGTIEGFKLNIEWKNKPKGIHMITFGISDDFKDIYTATSSYIEDTNGSKYYNCNILLRTCVTAGYASSCTETQFFGHVDIKDTHNNIVMNQPFLIKAGRVFNNRGRWYLEIE